MDAGCHALDCSAVCGSLQHNLESMKLLQTHNQRTTQVILAVRAVWLHVNATELSGRDASPKASDHAPERTHLWVVHLERDGVLCCVCWASDQDCRM